MIFTLENQFWRLVLKQLEDSEDLVEAAINS